MDQEKVLGAEKKRSVGIRPIKANDKIILFSTLNIDNKPTICFIAYTMVDEVYEDSITLYNKYKSPKKLKLKGIKYFSKPIKSLDITNELNFIKNKKKSSNYFKPEFREIEKADFDRIKSLTKLTKNLPNEFADLTFKNDEFILNLMKVIYDIQKDFNPKNQLEIKSFLKYINIALKEFNINQDLEKLEDFYSHNAWKLNFKHTRSRDPDRSVILYNRLGKKRIFSYISLA